MRFGKKNNVSVLWNVMSEMHLHTSSSQVSAQTVQLSAVQWLKLDCILHKVWISKDYITETF